MTRDRTLSAVEQDALSGSGKGKKKNHEQEYRKRTGDGLLFGRIRARFNVNKNDIDVEYRRARRGVFRTIRRVWFWIRTVFVLYKFIVSRFATGF